MIPNSLVNSLVLLAAARCVASATYWQSSSLTGENFVNAFDWRTDSDPNWGRVNYVDLKTAQSKGLVSVDGNKVTLRADSTTVLNSTGPGRDSFDLMSFNQYTTHVAMQVFDIEHMPEGCGTWPAVCMFLSLPLPLPSLLFFLNLLPSSRDLLLRELGPNWPNGGEIDIVEGVNTQMQDLITLHTGANCTMPADRNMTGTSKGTNCDVYATNTTSCGVSVNAANSYGPSFNAAGGGWYAIERTPSFIKIFFWSRDDQSVPRDVSCPGFTIDTDNWGTPTAYFPSSDSCEFNTHLGPFNIVIDLDFCGSWAGEPQFYNPSGCPSTCVDFVDSNPSAFNNAYFTFNSLNIYEDLDLGGGIPLADTHVPRRHKKPRHW